MCSPEFGLSFGRSSKVGRASTEALESAEAASYADDEVEGDLLMEEIADCWWS